MRETLPNYQEKTKTDIKNFLLQEFGIQTTTWTEPSGATIPPSEISFQKSSNNTGDDFIIIPSLGLEIGVGVNGKAYVFINDIPVVFVPNSKNRYSPVLGEVGQNANQTYFNSFKTFIIQNLKQHHVPLPGNDQTAVYTDSGMSISRVPRKWAEALKESGDVFNSIVFDDQGNLQEASVDNITHTTDKIEKAVQFFKKLGLSKEVLNITGENTSGFRYEKEKGVFEITVTSKNIAEVNTILRTHPSLTTLEIPNITSLEGIMIQGNTLLQEIIMKYTPLYQEQENVINWNSIPEGVRIFENPPVGFRSRTEKMEIMRPDNI